MVNQETAMLAYARLARLSHERQQPLGRDRFLVLTGASACYAGWPEIADVCRRLIVSHNPRHFLADSASFADALRDPANRGYFDRANRLCSFEQAEHLLAPLGGVPQLPADSTAEAVVRADLDALRAPK